MKVTLYVNYYADASVARQAELDECLRRNLANPFIDQVVVLAQVSPPLAHEKLICIHSTQRPTFRRYFETVNGCTAADGLNIITNSDIYFDESLGELRGVELCGGCLALTRWDVQAGGNSVPLGWNNSQDAWVFQGHIRLMDHCDYYPGQPACDWALAAELRRCGYSLFNPSRDIRAHHLHLCGVRRYTNKEFVEGNHSEVEVGDLTMLKKRNPEAGVIAFSLFGDSPRYTTGAVENVMLARSIYPGWTCRFYVDLTVPRECVSRLLGMGAEVIVMPRPEHVLQGAFWRFLTADDPGFERWMIRDADSRLSYRERRAVDEWIASGAPFHIMHDHPWHTSAIMGCAFGGRRGAISDMAGKIREWTQLGFYGADEQFLSDVIYPLVKDVALRHNGWVRKYGGLVHPFPAELEDFRFVGERVEADGKPFSVDRQALMEAWARRENCDRAEAGNAQPEKLREAVSL